MLNRSRRRRAVDWKAVKIVDKQPRAAARKKNRIPSRILRLNKSSMVGKMLSFDRDNASLSRLIIALAWTIMTDWDLSSSRTEGKNEEDNESLKSKATEIDSRSEDEEGSPSSFPIELGSRCYQSTHTQSISSETLIRSTFVAVTSCRLLKFTT